MRRAFLNAALRRAFINGAPLDEAVPETLKEQADRPAVSDDSKWFVTYVFEREVEVPPYVEAPDDSLYQWLDLSAWSDTDTALRDEAEAALDALVGYTVGIVSPTFFDRVAIPFALYYATDDGRFALVPQLSPGSLSASIESKEPFPADALRARMAALGQSTWQSHEWLHRVWTWHARALTETPGWRLFMAAWTGLEVLARRAGRQMLARHEKRSDLPQPMQKSLEYADKPNPPLAADFAALTLELSPETAERDFERFITIKSVRDQLLHGDPLEENSLPDQDARALLGEYVEKVAIYYLGS